MNVIEKRTGRIPSCRISTELIRDLAEAVHEGGLRAMAQDRENVGPEPSKQKDYQRWSDWHFASARLEELHRIGVSIESPDRTASSPSLEGLKEMRLPTSLSKITIAVNSPYSGLSYSANITFNVRDPDLSEYAVEGRDAQIVNGVTRTLEDLFRSHRESHALFYKDRYIVIFAVLFALLLSHVVLRVGAITGLLHPADPVAAFFALAILLWWAAWYPTYKLLAWLFPYFTYDEDPQGNRRKWLLSVIVVGIVLSLVSELIGRFLFP